MPLRIFSGDFINIDRDATNQTKQAKEERKIVDVTKS